MKNKSEKQFAIASMVIYLFIILMSILMSILSFDRYVANHRYDNAAGFYFVMSIIGIIYIAGKSIKYIKDEPKRQALRKLRQEIAMANKQKPPTP